MADLQLSEAWCEKYTGRITAFRDELQVQCDKAVELLPGLFGPGFIQSALDTQDQLELNIREFVTRLRNYIGYLDAYEDSVNSTCQAQVSGS
jgi:hypothetical protein